jgi:hypothetical protein
MVRGSLKRKATKDLHPEPNLHAQLRTGEGERQESNQHDSKGEESSDSSELGCDESFPYDSSATTNDEGMVEDEHVYAHELFEDDVVGISVDDSEMIEWMKSRELFYRADPAYIQTSQMAYSRARLIEWLQHVTMHHPLRRLSNFFQ